MLLLNSRAKRLMDCQRPKRFNLKKESSTWGRDEHAPLKTQRRVVWIYRYSGIGLFVIAIHKYIWWICFLW
ncbi:hypothetical protein ES288_A03G201300v1 [Gossypium darwinii]|uniref:Uncharacterized protein n=1 Tax=Gossypium darwinii TaxID=34276 RepID=A0A5D2H703_GOSDA|nr:hypothetical protein ES288_A03G201300v1 [Gossypium darwinii]